jgi:predicted transcriptional regulator
VETAFRVHPELRDYIRHESEEENAMLEQSLLSEGCRDPLVVWKEENVLVDGHHRFEICERHGIPYTVKYQSFASVKEAKAWMRKNQIARRNLDKAERDQWIKEMRDEGWTQQAIADELRITKGRVSQVEKSLIAKHADQPSPKATPAEDKEKMALKEEVAYYAKLFKEQEQQLSELARTKKAFEEMAFDRNQAREEVRAMAKELEVLKNSASEPQSVQIVKVVDDAVTSEKLAEIESQRLQMEKEWERKCKDLKDAREADKAQLQETLDRKKAEIDAASRMQLDIAELENEKRLLENKKRSLEAEIKSASIVEKIQRRLRDEHDAFTHGAAVLQIVTNEILERDDCAGLSVEDLELLERDLAKVGVCVRELIPAVHAVIEKIKNGGVLRIV